MFPLKDNIPARRFPLVNLWLIIINILCFAFEMTLGPQLEPFIIRYGFVPARFLAEEPLTNFRLANFSTMFSSMFLHGNFFHVFSNMWMLWIFGDNVEDRMGHTRYLFFYFCCGVAAICGQLLATPQAVSPMIGASGAISGVIGAYFLLYPRARILTFVPVIIFFYFIEVPAFVFIGLWFVMQFLQGAAQQAAGGEGGIAWWAHVGGFIAGVGLLYFFKGRKSQGRK